jgi:dihydroorotate dehydrogenase (fumarate)
MEFQTSSSLPNSNTLPPFSISPPLLNSSNPWATTREDLLALYNSPYTGAVTLRTSLWGGFPNDPKLHQYTFFSPSTGHSTVPVSLLAIEKRNLNTGVENEKCSLNTLGYSPVSFEKYMQLLVEMSRDGSLAKAEKPFLVSVSGSAEEVGRCAEWILRVLNDAEIVYPLPPPSEAEGIQRDFRVEKLNLMMEVNLSCPNILDKPPPAYDGLALREYISTIAAVKSTAFTQHPKWRDIHVGIKTPPYTHAGQFNTLISALESNSSSGMCPISFITATNTLGSCLVLDAEGRDALGSANGSGIGGLAGEALHPLALGNVRTIRTMLDESEFVGVRGIKIVGIGGVGDAEGWRRMRSVGAEVVGVGTALGRKGVAIFEDIAKGVGSEEFV